MKATGLIAGLILAVVMWFHVTAPPELGAGPIRHCTSAPATLDGQWECFLPGDVPAGATVVWTGPEADIPK